MPEYIERDAAKEAICLTILHDGIRDALKCNIDDIPAAEVVSRKAYLDAIGTINQAHLYPERSAEIIDEFLGRYHALCMEE